MRLGTDAFLTRLTRMYEGSKEKGTVQVTMKRTRPRGKERAALLGPDADEDTTVCLVRATLRSKKISTLVVAKEAGRFQVSLNNILKVHMDSLKRKRKKAKPTSSSASRRKKKEGA